MACCSVNSVTSTLSSSSSSPSPSANSRPKLQSFSSSSSLCHFSPIKVPIFFSAKSPFVSNLTVATSHAQIAPRRRTVPSFVVLGSASPEKKLRVMISGAPASGKGTQCQLITQKYGLVHIAAGDLLRAEIASGSENGMQAKEYMEKGQLVPDEIVVMMVKDRLSQPDCLEKGWLLDGYPRSLSQAMALKQFGFEPDLFILLEVPEESLVERVVGRRLDPVTGRIYHIKFSPPESEEIASRLTQRFDDTEEKVKLRLLTHNQNVEAVLSMYEDITVKIHGGVARDEVFKQIDVVFENLVLQKASQKSLAA